MKQKQTGFTLVEIAIVLVIIGLLLGGVLKGQEMVETSRTKAVLGDMRAIQTAFQSYMDRYRGIPGDENNAAVTAARGWTTAANGNANGVLLIPINATFNAGGEQNAMWGALRASGFLTGNPAEPAATANPRNAAGGWIGVTAPGGPVFGMAGNAFVCASGLTTRQAAALETLVDGPLPANQTGNNIGTLRGASGPQANAAAAAGLINVAAPAPLAYTTDGAAAVPNPWVLCMAI